MTPEYVLKRDSKPAHCSELSRERRYEYLTGELQYAEDYAEPGYNKPERGILFGNWNYASRKASDLLERMGYALEWSDEWTTCEDCGKAIRTSPNCYDWTPYYVEQDGAVCFNCVDWESYLESIEDRPSKAAMSHVNPADYGYMRVSDAGEYENGFHPGQNDNPEAILEALHECGVKRVLFRISSKGQFDISFETWRKAEEESE